MVTRLIDDTPRLDSLVVAFTEGPFPASVAAGSIEPTRASIGVDTLFAYTLQLEMGDDDAGVGRLSILTPWPAQLNVSDVEGLGGAAIASSYATNDSLVLNFDPPITADTGTTELVIPFTTRLLSASHVFQGLLSAPGDVAALQVERREGTDPDSELSYTIVTQAADFRIPILSDVTAQPGAFSPNGDGINDVGVVSFTLGRVSNSLVGLEIYDLSGRLVRSLTPVWLDVGSYAPIDGRSDGLPGRWDGKDEAGDPVPPGLYMYQIVVDLEPNDAVATGVIGVAY